MLRHTSIHFECLTGKIVTPSRYNLALCAVYRPPNTNKYAFTNELARTLSFAQGLDLLVIGDINIDLKRNDSVKKTYLSVMSENGLVSGIADYTRIETRKGVITKSCIDHVLVRSRLQDVYCAALCTKLSDHKMTAVALLGGTGVQDVPIYVKKLDNKLLNEELKNISWDACADLNCPTKIYTCINNNISACYKKCTSLKRLSSSKRSKEPWVTREISRECEKRDLLFLDWLKDTENAIKRLDYNKQRNKTNKLVDQSRNNYYRKQIQINKGDMRQLWQILNRMSGKISNSINDIIKKSFESYGSDGDIANQFAKKFKENVKNIIPNCNHKILEESSYRKPLNSSMLFKKATSKDIYKLINKTKTNKAPGIDAIRAIDIRAVAEKIAGAIAHLINTSFNTGEYPDDLKVGLVKPIFKGGPNKTDCSNYRPITMLPIVDKIVEKFVCNQIQDFYQKNNVLSQNQFGFQPKKSTSMLLSRFSDEINKHLDNKRHVLVVFIDYSKAFDTLRHDTLVKKLGDTGVRGPILEWCRSYLENRTYCVKVGQSCSDQVQVTEGTAQGSVLGPLHYLSYVNDMNNCVEHCSIYQFADDTCVVAADVDLREAEKKLQHDFDRVCQWSHDAGLVLNGSKTKLMHIHSNQCRTVRPVEIFGHDHECLHANISSQCRCLPLQQVSEQKYLGVIIDENFNWGAHVDMVCDKLRAVMAKIYVLKNRIPFSVRLSLYTSLAESIVSYGLSSYGRTFKSYLDRIYNLQIRLLKLVLPFNLKNKFKTENEIFNFCEVLPIHYKYSLQFLKEHYMRTDLLQPVAHSKVTRQVSNKMLVIPRTSNYYGTRITEFILPTLLNKLSHKSRDEVVMHGRLPKSVCDELIISFGYRPKRNNRLSDDNSIKIGTACASSDQCIKRSACE
ncbi:reverse transcriptase (RNA-dependent DNA polymerase) domain-containing protein [Phthorimaea operculella]|nr:reverse transcriptase (RNA-dependent DNA polymerase) domain-containing protein [Phthorimaea operculella]